MKVKNRLKRFWDSGLFYNLTTDTARTHTRKINPKLGLLGFAGFLGFLGFLPQPSPIPFAFLFFAFFGFFSFYYEGKMSGTLIDERFQFNAYRAEAIAHKTSLKVLIIGTIVFAGRFHDAYTSLSFLLALIGLTFGCSILLQGHLLYRFENED
ncbi:MAG: DUF3796 domain-containing protein [Cellulosilyticaceae bacterium]